jgi:hypothetical protein
MKFWILVCAPLVVAAVAAYRVTTRRARARDIDDQVSSDWLATAKIHEDNG